MYRVITSEKQSKVFAFLEMAKSFAKRANVWYYITDGCEVVYTQDDEIFERLME